MEVQFFHNLTHIWCCQSLQACPLLRVKCDFCFVYSKVNDLAHLFIGVLAIYTSSPLNCALSFKLGCISVLFLCCAGDPTQGLKHTRQACYHWVIPYYFVLVHFIFWIYVCACVCVYVCPDLDLHRSNVIQMTGSRSRSRNRSSSI